MPFLHWNQKFITIPGSQEGTTRLEAEKRTRYNNSFGKNFFWIEHDGG